MKLVKELTKVEVQSQQGLLIFTTHCPESLNKWDKNSFVLISVLMQGIEILKIHGKMPVYLFKFILNL